MIAANSEQSTLTPEKIPHATLSLGAEKIPQLPGKSDEIWLANIYNEAGEDATAYLRICGKRQMMSELICSAIGRTLGLPIPPPFLVTVDRSLLPASQFLRTFIQPKEKCLMFASGAITGAINFAQLLKTNSPSANKMMAQWEAFPKVCTFDELFANTDRNLSNIIFQANILWIIDHAEAFGGSQADLYQLRDIATNEFPNLLIDTMKPSLQNSKRERLLTIAREVIMEIQEMDLHAILNNIGDEFISVDGGIDEVLNFINTRFMCTTRFLGRRLGVPQLTLVQL